MPACATGGIAVAAVSRWHETAPVGGPSGQGPFLNGALLLETSLDPEPLRQALSRVEFELGRSRDVRWQARSLDLDLLLFDQRVLTSPELTIPHPRMAFRRFVLEPAAEIAPDMLHPLIGWRMDELLRNLNVGRPYVAITGVPGLGKTPLAQRLAAEFQGRAILLPEALAADSRLKKGTGTSRRRESVEPTERSLGASPLFQPAARAAPGRELEREIEFLDSLAELVRPASFPPGNRVVVSDFWLDQTLAYANVRLGAEGFNAFRETQTLRRLATTPATLLVFLTSESPPQATASHESLPGDSDRLQKVLGQFALRRGIGPVLPLSVDDQGQMLQEVRAAIAAML